MKRRILAAALSAALVLALAACGGGNNGGSTSNPGGGSSQTDGSADPSTSDGSQPGNSSEDTSLPDGSQPDTSEPDTGASSSAGTSNPGGASNPGGEASNIKLTLNRTNIELNKAGATFKLRYTVDPDIYDGVAVFTSSDTKVATVDDSGTVKAVAPGKATITVKYDSATATASVNCNWKESQLAPSEPESSKPSGGDTSKPADPPASSNVDLSAFYSTITGKYEFPMPQLADDGILDNFYAGMTGISTEQRLIYVCGISMNNGEFGLVQVKDSKDVDAVKNIFQARINYMVGDGNGPGGAYYPAAMEQWENNARVVSNGNYVMMVVHENCDDIVKEFNALF